MKNSGLMTFWLGALESSIGSLHILESFAGTRIFSNKVKIKNTKNKFSRTVGGVTHRYKYAFFSKTYDFKRKP